MDFNLVFKNKHLEKLHQDNNFFSYDRNENFTGETFIST